jgi:hypothetical protein
MDVLGNRHKQEIGRHANNRVENSHLPFRRRERAMLRFRQMRSLQMFASVHANVHNLFALERHLIDRTVYKKRRSAALMVWTAPKRHRCARMRSLQISSEETVRGSAYQNWNGHVEACFSAPRRECGRRANLEA